MYVYTYMYRKKKKKKGGGVGLKKMNSSDANKEEVCFITDPCASSEKVIC